LPSPTRGLCAVRADLARSTCYWWDNIFTSASSSFITTPFRYQSNFILHCQTGCEYESGERGCSSHMTFAEPSQVRLNERQLPAPANWLTLTSHLIALQQKIKEKRYRTFGWLNIVSRISSSGSDARGRRALGRQQLQDGSHPRILILLRESPSSIYRLATPVAEKKQPPHMVLMRDQAVVYKLAPSVLALPQSPGALTVHCLFFTDVLDAVLACIVHWLTALTPRLKSECILTSLPPQRILSSTIRAKSRKGYSE